MKATLLLLFSSLLLNLNVFCQEEQAQKEEEKKQEKLEEKVFKFKGVVHAYGETMKGVLIEVYDGGDLTYEFTTKGNGKFEFEVKSEREYMVEISAEEMRMKTLWVNTRKTAKLTHKVPDFGFDVYLKKEKITPYDELSEIPVTLIKYQPKKKAFYMDKTYENAVKNKKQKIKDDLPAKLR